MYTSFFNIREEPFSLSADPRFFYYNEEYRKAFKYITYGIKNREGFVEILGDVGVGKTAFCHALINQLGPDTHCIFIPHAYFSELEFLELIADKLGVEHKGATQSEILRSITAYLQAQYAASRNVVLIFDEAHNLSPNLLQQIRLLSNVSGNNDKPLQVILAGQLELEDKLRHTELKDVDQRISVRYRIKPLKRSDLEKYIVHRLKTAGCSPDEIVFTAPAYYKIWRFSKGTPRLINIICDKSLLVAYIFKTKKITAMIIDSAIKNTQERWYRFPALFYYNSFRTAIKVAITVLIIVAAVNWGYQENFRRWLLKTGPTLSLIKIGVLNPFNLAANKEISSRDISRPWPTLPPEEFKSLVNTYGIDNGCNKLCLAGLLKIWGIEEPSGNFQQWIKGVAKTPDKDVASKYNLQTTVLDTNLDELEVINMPCILEEVYDANWGQMCSMLLFKLTPQNAILYHPSRGLTDYTRPDLERCWPGQAVVLWRNIDRLPDKPLPSPEATPLELGQISLRLRQLGYLKEGLDTSSDPQILRQAILNFQQANKLKQAGVMNVQSKIVLYRLLDRPLTPTLQEKG